MATPFTPGVDDKAATMACIGFVCVQWALLENNLLGLLATAQNILIEEAAIIFGGLDMRPRLNTAILLAEHHKWLPPLQKRLKELRAAIDKAKLIDRRNMLVHGVHKEADKPETFVLYSPRKKGSAQQEIWTVGDAYNVGLAIQTAATEVHAILMAYGEGKFGNQLEENQPS
jgi:hypothetical protein